VFDDRVAALLRPSAARAALGLIGVARFAADTLRPLSGKDLERDGPLDESPESP
jgi:hypothetical protein